MMKHWKPSTVGIVGVLVALAWWESATPAWAATVVAQADAPALPPTDVATLLAPMLSAALGIERFLETMWNLFERLAGQFTAQLGLGVEWAKHAHKQVVAAQQALATQAANPLVVDLQVAEDALFNAQSHLRSALDSDQYKSIKQVVSIFIGVGLGIGASIGLGIDMFQELGLVKQATLFGEILSGIIIGSGSAPVHSLIGLLQQGRDALNETATLLNKRAVTRVLENNQVAQKAGEEAAARGIAPPVPPAMPTPAQSFHLSRLARR